MSSLTSSDVGPRSRDSSDSNFRHPGPVRNQQRPASPADDSIIEIAPSEPSIMEIEPVNIDNNRSNMINNHHPVAGPSGLRTHPPNQRRPPQQPPRATPGNKTFMYCCETCKKKFSDAGRFQSHGGWHDSQGRSASMKCLVCPWSVTDTSVSGPVSQHLFSHRHMINVAKKMSQN